MKYEYDFVTGTKEVEIDEKWADVLEEFDRAEHNLQKTETRRHCSLDQMKYQGDVFSIEDCHMETFTNGGTDEEKLHNAIKRLKLSQREVVYAIYFQGLTQRQYAKKLGVSQSAISQRLATAEKNLKKFLVKTL